MKVLAHWFFLFALLSSHAHARIVVNGSMTQNFSACPGKVIKGTIPVNNSSDKTEEARIVLSDYLFSANGKNEFGEPGSHPRSNCSWISVSPNTLTLPPKGSGEFHFTVHVPSDPSLLGTYWGLIFVEPFVPAPLPDKEGMLGLRTVIRYGIHIITEIEESGTYNIQVGKREIQQKDNQQLLAVEVENVGNRYVNLKPSVDLYAKNGKLIKQVEHTKKLVFPTCSTKLQYDLTGVEPGEYLAFILLEHSEKALFGGQYTIDIPPPDTLKDER